MIPLEIEQKIYDYIPSVLEGHSFTKFKAGQIVDKPSYPYVVVGTPRAGGRTKPWLNNSVLRVVKEGAIYTDICGQYHKATVTVFVRSLDDEECNGIATALLKEVYKQKFDFSIEYDGFRFVDVLSPTLNSNEKDRGTSKLIYLAIIDLEFEYELSWADNSDPEIRRFYTVTNDGLRINVGLTEKTQGYVLSVPILKSRSRGYALTTKLVESGG